MSRMFRVVNGNGSEPQSDPRMLGGSIEPDPFAGDGIPFVEVGGPEGPVVQLPKPKPVVVDRPVMKSVITPIPIPKALAEPETKHLSVTFHRLPQIEMKTTLTGVAPELVVHHFPMHPVSLEYRGVRDAIASQFDIPGPRVVLFTAAAAICGTTTVLMNLAASLSQEHGNRVLLVDANFRKPGVARRLSCAETPGLAEVLGQSIPLAWALQPTPLTNLHVLAAGTSTEQTVDSMANDMPRLLTQLRQWFDWVIIDGGIWHELPGSLPTAASSDGVYLVSRSTNLQDAHFTALRSEITSGNAPVRGMISTQY